MTAPTSTPPCLGEREAVALDRTDAVARTIMGQTTALYALTNAIIAEHIEPLRTENETLRAERDAATARAEEAEGETRDARYKADCAEEDECDALGRAEEAESKLTTLRAELAQAKTQVAGMRRAFFKVAMIQARELQRMEPAGTTPPDLDAAMAELRRTLTNPEPPHGD